MLGSVSYSQSSVPSTGNNQNDRAELVSLMERAVAEVEQSRVMIEGYEAQIRGYEDAIAKAEKLDGDNQVLIGYLKAESAKVREALSEKQVALTAKQKEVDIYKDALAKEIKKKNFFKKIAKFSTVAAAVAVGLLVIQQ